MYTVRREGGAIIPERSTSVSMDAEDVVIERARETYMVTVTFTMRNQSDKQVDSMIAFPMLGSPKMLDDVNAEFEVGIKIAGDDSPFRPVKVQWKEGAKRKPHDDYFFAESPKKPGDFPASLVWDMSWKAGETKLVRVSFNMGEPLVLPGSYHLAGGWEIGYIVSTGALWKGPIGRADITFNFGDTLRSGSLSPGNIIQYSYPDQAKWNGKDSISWHFENWCPSEEMWFRSVTWNGLPPSDVDYYFCHLPPDYQGDKQPYSVELIDSLVERELKLVHQYFPEKVKSLDILVLRIAISDWLLHEIYARHGDSFFAGKLTSTNGVRHGFVGINNDGNLYSSWRDKFEAYRYRGGWYRPEHDVVKTASLAQMEQSNVQFLSKYLVQLREQLGPEKLRLTVPVHVPGS